ncbi:MAG: methyltransferase domain-containing protein [Proteobacteria bacterium]|nr:methyltransferase domain-containing protein [Pseudomonadota bacterium]
MIRLSREELSDIVSHHQHIASDDRDEMAIPSYLHGNPLIRWLMWHRYEAIAKLAELNSTQTVFEFGCGTGVFLPELSARCATVFATDLYPDFARTLCGKRNLNVVFVDDTAMLDDASIDLIIAADVQEHITDLSPHLEQFAAKLKSTGRFMVSGPTENFIYKIGRLLAGFGDKADYHHTNINDLIDSISDFGFTLNRKINLPFGLPPHLFRICEFSAP